MTTLIYDGTFEGLLTVVFEIYDRRLDRVNLQRNQPDTAALFENKLQVTTDEIRANRVLKGLTQRVSAMGIQRLYAAHLAEMEGEDNNLVGYIRYAFDSAQNIEEDYGNRFVLRVSEMVRMVRREKHRMEAFVRFQKLKDDIFYAAIEPDFNVLPLLIRHFKGRYADQKWIIYDLKRKYGIYYDLHDTQYISLDFANIGKAANIIAAFTEEETIYQHLWKNYFTSVNIPSRKNTRLHVRHIPKRYWKHLTEKI
ncbi:TIGR03915 family putative DNA repair protein [Mucilaginibacter sp. AK015]|uniref:TIGR03915 family putative DNA repair protein n=1 Tax=Mucilaginibacter sp. AK015 TaxID=2723072 RepID=UPI00161BBBFC|nr:TIGR03915 family putative DNA repair protein [Mucilaginibacter sp. AK015]MBB5394332.1 putative DNA metabolism protein [Mucilaginibacter sp. AK015]